MICNNKCESMEADSKIISMMGLAEADIKLVPFTINKYLMESVNIVMRENEDLAKHAFCE